MKPALARVLEEMHVEDTDFIVQMVILGADLSAAYDGFHSSNRNAQSGIGNFTSHDWGYVLLLTVLDKVRTEGVAGISQRLEKEGLKRGLLSLIVDYGLPIIDLCTDQCRGAPKDIGIVLKQEMVQKMLSELPAAMQAWTACELGCSHAVEGQPVRPWRAVVAELRGKLATMQVPAIAPTIDHHFDVFHVEVKLIEAAKKYFEAGTKTFRVSGADDSAAKKAVKAASAALPKGWSRHAGLMELLREQHTKGALLPVDLEPFGGSLDGECKEITIKAKQEILKRRVPAIRAAAADVMAAMVKAAAGIEAAPAAMPEGEGDPVLIELDEDGIAQVGEDEPENPDVLARVAEAATLAAEAAEGRARDAVHAAEQAQEELAMATRAGDAEAVRLAKAKADRQAAQAKEEARKQSIREANALRLHAREQTLGAESGLLDTIRHHFYCVTHYGSLLRKSETMEICLRAAWEYWEEGLIGHVLRRDHSHCHEDAECRHEGYKPRPVLNTLARSLFLGFVSSPKVRELIAKCMYNGHTWDCESLSNLCHMYQAKRIVLKRWQVIPMYCGKLDKNENRVTRAIRGWYERSRRTGMRRLAQKDTPRLVPLLEKKTSHWREEAKARLYRELVDRTAALPETKWPALFKPVAIVRPIPMPTPQQVPPLEARPPPAWQAERAAVPPPPLNPPPHDLPRRATQPSALRAVTAPTGSVTIVGPQVGESGSLLDAVLSRQPRRWRQPPFLVAAQGEPALDASAVSERLASMTLVEMRLVCPGCQTEAAAKLPAGITGLKCAGCSARFLVLRDPPKEKSKGGRNAPATVPRQPNCITYGFQMMRTAAFNRQSARRCWQRLVGPSIPMR